MKKCSLFLVFFFPVIQLHLCIAQDSRTEMLTTALEAHPERDTTRCRLLLELAGAVIRQTPRSAIVYCEEALSLAKKIDVKKAMIQAYNLTGQAWSYLSNIPQSEEVYGAALRLAKELNDSFEIARICNNYGIVLLNSGNAVEALPLIQTAESINQAMGRRDQLAGNQENLGITYCLLGDYEKALNWHLKALSFFESTGNKRKLGDCYMSIGNVFNYLKELEKAREYYGKSLVIKQEMNDRQGISNVSINIGICDGLILLDNILNKDKCHC